jgi:uncharacterized protein (TIRG00374 family)
LLKQLIKLIISFTLLAWVAMLIDYREMHQALSQLNFAFYLLAFAVFFAGVVLATLVWWALTQPLNLKIKFKELVKLNLICAFINNIFPAGIAGDLKKAYDLGIRSRMPAQAWASVIIERAVCGSANLILALLGFGLAIESLRKLHLILPLNYLLILLFLPLGLWLFRKEILKLLQKDIFAEIITSLSLYNHHWGKIISALLLGLISPVLESLAVYTLAYALGLKVPFLSLIFLIPANRILSALSLSVNNIGPQDAAFVLILQYFNLDSTQAFSLSILLHSIRIFSGFIGGIFFALQMKGGGTTRRER